MNLKRIFQQIYLITLTFIYMVAVTLVLIGIVVFAIVSEISKQVKTPQQNQRSTPPNLDYNRVFKKSVKTDNLSSKERLVLTMSSQKK